MDVVRNEAENRFEIDLGDATAISEYTVSGDRIRFTHTLVPPQHEGQGIGSKLIRASLDYAREAGLKVIPVCPFYVSYFERHPEAQDLLDPGYAKRHPDKFGE
ncbi:GNAT family N-acetyltransferase [Sphingosinithalassobacter portus]|uniref:GNAT family N-acetyltransferase n=1 Tax=Stakelama portus TaxID=2676234 RepID=UPI000D6DEFD8|nr:GNAT family N-acetyltransferase [Sphingosinithalassobacter portus]